VCAEWWALPLAELGEGWLVVRVQVPRERCEPLAGDLFALGALGLQETDASAGVAELAVYFTAAGPDEHELHAALAAADGWLVARETVPPADWLAHYREQARPLPLGRRFIADPRDPGGPSEVTDPDGRRILRLPARTAFGTGSHESTRLAVEMLELAPPAGCSVLDLGTGSGVLAYVALELGARRVVAIDIDPAAALVAGQIATLNGLEPLLAVGGIDCLGGGAGFDRILINIIPARWLPLREEVRRLLLPHGRLLVSGLLVEQRSEVLAALAQVGFVPSAARIEGDWLGLWLGAAATDGSTG
jgi:ribosomal protein L11 methyltransferase